MTKMPFKVGLALMLFGAMSTCVGRAATTSGDMPGGSVDQQRTLARLHRPIMDYSVTAYRSKEGAPAEVVGLAQTRDGVLWLGTPQGLVRFDGATFQADSRVQKFVESITTDRHDGLWIGYKFGGVSHLVNGRLEDVSQGLPATRSVFGLAIDRSDVVWARTSLGLFKLQGTTWTRPTPSDGLPDDVNVGLLGTLNDGSVWAVDKVDRRKAWRQSPSDGKFQALDAHELWPDLFGVEAQQVPQDIAQEIEQLFNEPYIFWVKDASGAVWHSSPPLSRMRWIERDGHKEVVDEPVPSADVVKEHLFTGFLADREGNIWLADVDGIYRISANKLQAVAPRKAIVAPALARGLNGDVWIGAFQGKGLYHVVDSNVISVRSQEENLSVLWVDRLDQLWMLHFSPEANGAPDSYIELRDRDGHFSRIAYPVPPFYVPAAVANNPTGGYLLTAASGVYRYVGEKWVAGLGNKDLPSSPALRLANDKDGRLWLAYPDGSVAMLNASSWKLFPSNEVSLGVIYAIYPDGQRVWLAGDRGIAYIADDRVIRPQTGADNPFRSATGIITTTRGELWVNSAKGVYRVSKDGVLALVSGHPPLRETMELFDDQDGLLGANNDIVPGPTLAEGGDGRIWIARLDGANWIDPANILRNPSPAQAYVTSVSVDEKTITGNGTLRIPPNVHSLRLDYSAASLTRPERVTFRYRLDGLDTEWQEAGTRRFALYSNPPPGSYDFRVIAFNEDGTTNGPSAHIPLTIEPALYQTWWFKVLCVLGAITIAFIAYRYRLRRAHEEMRFRLEATQEERDRIARELHDTFMQTVQGLALQVHAWSEDHGIAPDRRDEMRRAAYDARDVLKEGRDKILDLRATAHLGSSLTDELRRTGEAFASLYPPAFDIKQSGPHALLRPEAFEDILQIGREGIRNAFTHAQASEIGVSLHYGTKHLSLTIADDGTGMLIQPANYEQAPGHWGLIGMKERAQRLRGKISIAAGKSRGTEVRLIVPAQVAYLDRVSRLQRRLADLVALVSRPPQ